MKLGCIVTLIGLICRNASYISGGMSSRLKLATPSVWTLEYDESRSIGLKFVKVDAGYVSMAEGIVEQLVCGSAVSKVELDVNNGPVWMSSN